MKLIKTTTSQPIDPFFNKYIEIKEFISFFNSIRRLTIKRKYYDACVEILTNFIDITFENSLNLSRLDDLIKNNQKLNRVNTKNNTLNTLYDLDPTGFRLIGLDFKDKNFNLDKLKKMYRSASKTHHPDMGGNLEEMKRVNEAYSLFHEFLSRSVHVNIESNDEELTDRIDFERNLQTEDFFLEVFLCLSNVKIETGSFDEAEDLISNLCTMKLNQRKSFKYLKDVYPDAAKLRISQNQRKSILLRSECSIDHAYRLGQIDEIKYLNLHDRLIKKKSLLVCTDKILNNFYKKRIHLDFDLMFEYAPTVDIFVNYPSYWDCRIQLLSDSQKNEYLYAFKAGATFDLVEKYKFVRITSLIANTIYFPSFENLDRSIEELNFLINNTDDPGGDYQKSLSLLVGWKKSGFENFKKRAKILHSINDLYYIRPNGIVIQISDDGELNFHEERFSIDCWKRSRDFMNQPIDLLLKKAKL